LFDAPQVPELQTLKVGPHGSKATPVRA